ncbi:uncharacterized protein B0H64DRAFT_441709 [Chaetomium fimeti]|uniref:SGNH hydrolase-type esterase domain-containing protein n=1 Tax=Chaetomium fimeti TaxID=1854472 RepID=A0AAE0HEX7_9PEZI|nr:hypothetical protein B0H64DRAFT_441709 [Chaetomium fimeti]
MESILATLKPFAEYKQRSYEISKNVHIPLLEGLSDPSDGPVVVFLGDGIFENMITTGESPNFPAPWPSPALLSEATLATWAENPNMAMYRASRLLNAGVSGDRIQNLVYRLVGDEDEGGTLPGLLPLLARCGTVQTWVLHIGRENVSAENDGLSDEDIMALKQLVLALFSINPAGGVKTKIVLTYMFGEKLEVYRGNEAIKNLEKRLNNPDTGIRNTLCLRTPAGYIPDQHLVDDVHLNLDGYKIFAELLWSMAPAGTYVSGEHGYNLDLRKRIKTETETKGGGE